MTPEEMVARLLYRDGLMLVLDKPAGMAVHRGPKGGESLEDHFDALRFGLPRAPALAHRLDRDTSGCLVLGRHRKALAELGRLFKSGKIGKTYWAVVEGEPEADEGLIDLPLGRRDETRGWWMKPDPTGQPAVTTWKVLGRTKNFLISSSKQNAGTGSLVTSPLVGEVGRPKVGREGGNIEAYEFTNPPLSPTLPQRKSGLPDLRTIMRNSGKPEFRGGGSLSWLALKPLTGRTHQLRVHCAEMGWPILGDNIYGSAPRSGGPILHLHSREIVVPISKNKPPVAVTAPVPEHMRERLTACGWES